LPVAIL